MKIINIKELKNQLEWKEAFLIMKQLRTHLDEASYLRLVQEAKEKNHYKMAALYENEQIAAAIGFMPMVTLYNGSFIWVCDLIVDANSRSKGYGAKLLHYVEDWSQKHGYNIVSLSSGLQRVDAHRFYEEKMNYDKVSYVFLKRW